MTYVQVRASFVVVVSKLLVLLCPFLCDMIPLFCTRCHAP